MLSFKDVFKVPFTNVKIPYAAIWVFYVLLSAPLGILLWAITLGGFRYFHLSGLVCDHLTELSLKQTYRGYK